MPELLLRGNDPIAIFVSLAELGKLTVTANMEAVPRLRSIDAERCYLKWTLELESDCAREQVDAAFEWAAVDCELAIKRVEAGASPRRPTPQAVAAPVCGTAAAAPVEASPGGG